MTRNRIVMDTEKDRQGSGNGPDEVPVSQSKTRSGPPKSDQEAKPIRLGLIGAGVMGERHSRTVEGVRGIEVAAVCDLDAERARALASQCGAEGHSSWQELVNSGVDAITICAPHSLHADIAVGAMEKGCHVLVEKPMAVNVKECRRMIAAAKESTRRLHVAEIALYAPLQWRIRELYLSGSLGRFLTGRIQSMRPYFTDNRPRWFLDPKLSGGGMFMNLGPHRLGVTRTCLPDLTPAWVDAQVITLHGQPVEAFVSARVGYREGGVIQLEQNGHFSPPKRWSGDPFLVFEEAFVGWTGDGLCISRRDGSEQSESVTPLEDNYQPVYEDFVRGIAGEPTLCPPIEDMATDIAIIRAIYESGKLNQRVTLEDFSG
jgi:predicted dehydrogenase